MNVIVRLAVVLALLAGAVFLAGTLLPAKHEATAHISVEAAPEGVWAVLAAVENYPTWRSDVATSEILRPRPSLVWRQSDPKGRSMTL